MFPACPRPSPASCHPLIWLSKDTHAKVHQDRCETAMWERMERSSMWNGRILILPSGSSNIETREGQQFLKSQRVSWPESSDVRFFLSTYRFSQHVALWLFLDAWLPVASSNHSTVISHHASRQIRRLQFFARHFTFDSHVRQRLHSYCHCSLDTSTDSLMMLYVCVRNIQKYILYIQYLLAFAYCDRFKGLVGCKCKESSEFNSSDTWSNSNLLAQFKVSPWPQPWKTNIRSPCSSMSAHRPSRFHLSDRNKTFFGERSPWRMDGPWMWDCEMQKNTGSRS